MERASEGTLEQGPQNAFMISIIAATYCRGGGGGYIMMN